MNHQLFWHGITTATVVGAFLVSASLASAQSRAPTYARVDLVSDIARAAPVTDAALVNAWGIAVSGNARWVADNGTGQISMIGALGSASGYHIVLPSLAGSSGPASPTGLVLNTTLGNFFMAENGLIAPAYVLVATEDGTIAGWNPGFHTPKAFTVIDSRIDQASYKGLALVDLGTTARLLATDFANERIDVFDTAFQRVDARGMFVDPQLPAHYAPFGIQAAGEYVFVTYAYKANRNDGDETAGDGLGLVAQYKRDGVFVRQLATGRESNAPWGIAASKVKFSGGDAILLVGNFGDGRINEYDMNTGEFVHQLADERGAPIAIEGLWGIAFPPDGSQLYFGAGPADESHGLFGYVRRTDEGPFSSSRGQ